MLVAVAGENAFTGRDSSLQGAGQMPGQRDGVWRGAGRGIILHLSPELAEGSTAVQKPHLV